MEPARALNAARETGHAPTLMFALFSTTFTHICCRDYAAGSALIDEFIALAEEKGAEFLKALATAQRGCVLALTSKASEAVQTISVAITAYRSTGATVWATSFLSYLALAYAEVGKFDDAWRVIGEAMSTIETTKERWFEAETNRIAGEIALKSPEPDAQKRKHISSVRSRSAREQQAKSWELRAATSMARLWRDQGSRSKPANCSHRSTAGSLKASTRSI